MWNRAMENGEIAGSKEYLLIVNVGRITKRFLF